MQYWLAKTEPEVYGWDDLADTDEAMWDGVRNYAARNNMQRMVVGDLVFIYHSGKRPAIVGTARVSQEHFNDPADSLGKWSAIKLKAEKRLDNPVFLSTIKESDAFAESSLVKNSRLSVHKLSKAQYENIIALSKD